MKYKDAIMELVDAMDSYDCQSQHGDMDKPFIMPIRGRLLNWGRGTVAAGHVEQGVVKLNDRRLKSLVLITQEVGVTGDEAFKNLDQVEAGDNAGVLLRGIERSDVSAVRKFGKKPGTITPYWVWSWFYILKKEESGRHTPFSEYKPQFYFRTLGIYGRSWIYNLNKEMDYARRYCKPSKVGCLRQSLWARLDTIRKIGRTVELLVLLQKINK